MVLDIHLVTKNRKHQWAYEYSLDRRHWHRRWARTSNLIISDNYQNSSTEHRRESRQRVKRKTHRYTFILLRIWAEESAVHGISKRLRKGFKDKITECCPKSLNWLIFGGILNHNICIPRWSWGPKIDRGRGCEFGEQLWLIPRRLPLSIEKVRRLVDIVAWGK